jgi:hypothetical protein
MNKSLSMGKSVRIWDQKVMYLGIGEYQDTMARYYSAESYLEVGHKNQ